MSNISSDYLILVGLENISLIHRVTQSVITAKILGMEECGDEKTYWLDGRLSRAPLDGSNDGLNWELTGAISTVCKIRPQKDDGPAEPGAC